jgi:RimJ/RimL family protein N-acetyltransferase
VGFVTERLEVRCLAMTDLHAFHEVWGDPRVIFWGASKDLETTRQLLRELVDRRFDGIVDSGWFAVQRRDDGRLVGDVVLEPASWNRELPEIGWHFAKVWQGRGYATEAAQGLLDHARRHGLAMVYAKILHNNDASQGVARRIGMRIVGQLDHRAGSHDIWMKKLDALQPRQVAKQ